MRLRISAFVGALLAVLAASVASSYAQAQAWPTRPVKFIVPFGPGAGADIGARLFADKLSQRWGQPVVIENRPGGDSIVAIKAFLSANDDHVLLFGPSGNFTVHPFNYSKLSYNPDRPHSDRARLEHHPGRRSRQERALQQHQGVHRGRARQSRQIQLRPRAGHHRVHLLGLYPSREAGYPQVPYRDINVAPVDLGEGPHPGGDGVACDRAAADGSAGRIKLFARQQQDAHAAGAGHADRARAGLSVADVRRPGRPVRAQDHVERAQGEDRRRLPEAAADGSIAASG